MAIYSGIFNSVNGDRKYNAWWFAKYFSSFISNGVFPNPSNNLQVVENENMTVTIKPGLAWINGYFLYSDSDIFLELDNADGVLKRIDRIVLRLNNLTRQIEILFKKGTFASNPVAPTLQRDADYWELAIADIYIANGATQITQANITDTRLNTSLCGIVHGTVNQVDTTTIFNQYQSWFGTFTVEKEQEFQQFIDDLNDLLDGDVATNLLTRLVSLENAFNAHLGESATDAHKISNITGLQTALDGKLSTTGKAASSTTADSATKLTTPRQIDGINFDGTANLTRYITSSTAAATVTKTATLSTFNLVSGAELTLRLTNGNTATNPTLNVSSKGAKPLMEMIDGVATNIKELPANSILKLVYDTSIVSGGAFIVLGKGGGEKNEYIDPRVLINLGGYPRLFKRGKIYYNSTQLTALIKDYQGNLIQTINIPTNYLLLAFDDVEIYTTQDSNVNSVTVFDYSGNLLRTFTTNNALSYVSYSLLTKNYFYRYNTSSKKICRYDKFGNLIKEITMTNAPVYSYCTQTDRFVFSYGSSTQYYAFLDLETDTVYSLSMDNSRLLFVSPLY